MGTGNFYYENILAVPAPDDEDDEVYVDTVRMIEDRITEDLEKRYAGKKLIRARAVDKTADWIRGGRQQGRVFAQVSFNIWDRDEVTISLVTYPGYYSHANIDYHVEADPEWGGRRTERDLLEHPAVDSAIAFVEETIKKHTEEFAVSARFSSGETWYKRVNQ